MELQEIFSILGIDVTRDKNAIKTAYRGQLVHYNPEDDEVGFKRLRNAYEQALAYADAPEEQGEEAREQDNTPSGLAVQEFAKIYENMSLRRDEQVFEDFFAKDIFLSLEYDEECREKVLVYMMSHFYFPTKVWKVLDKHLHITERKAALKEKFPQDYINFLANRCRNGEDICYEYFEGDEHAEYDEFIHYTEKIFGALKENRVDFARQCLDSADKLGIYNPFMEIARSVVLKQENREEEGIQVLEKIHERYPDDSMISYNLAEAYWSVNRHEDAAKIFLDIHEKNKEHYMSNLRLTEWYFEQKEYVTAKKYANEVMNFGGSDEFMELIRKLNQCLEEQYTQSLQKGGTYKDKLELAWCYLQDGKVLKGLKLVDELENEVADCDRTEYIGMRAKYYTECGRYEEVLIHGEKWIEALLREKPDNYQKKLITGHYLIANALHYLGQNDNAKYERAIEEFLKLKEQLQEDFGALIKLANIYGDAGRIDKCEELAERLEERGVYVGHIILLEAYERLRNASGVIEQSKKVVHFFPDYVRAYELAARVFYVNDAYEALQDVLQLAGQNKAESVILEAYDYLYKAHMAGKELPSDENLGERVSEIYKRNLDRYVSTGDEADFKEGEREITECLMQFPSSYMLIERGLYYLRVQKHKEAEADFLKALEDEPYNQYAWNNLGCVYLEMGDYDKAYIHFIKSICFSNFEYQRPYVNLLDVFDAVEEYDHAESLYNEIFKRFEKTDEDFPYGLTELYENQGKVDKALELAERAFKDDFSLYYKEILAILLENKRFDAAKALVAKWQRKILLRRFLKDTQQLSNDQYVFYRETSWYYLLTGNTEKAVSYMEKIVTMAKKRKIKDRAEACEELLFMLYLAGKYVEIKKYAKQMRELTEKKGLFVLKKKYLHYLRFLGVFFDGDAEEAANVLESMKDCPNCPYCTMAHCKEYEIARAMLLGRQKKKEEAVEIVRKLTQSYRLDKYVIALEMYMERCLN